MSPWRNARTTLLVVLALVVGFNLLQALNGCSGNNTAVNRVAEAIGMDPYPLSSGNSQELSRFNAVFNTYASDTTDTRQLKQFRDAYKRVLHVYVQEVSDAGLIDAAINGVEEGEPEVSSLPAADLVEKGPRRDDGVTGSPYRLSQPRGTGRRPNWPHRAVSAVLASR